MAMPLERDEYIEQAYFFRTFRERMFENVPAQDLLQRLPEELLSTTKLPLAVQFLNTELKHTGELGRGFAKLPHYFTPFQAFAVNTAEDEGKKFPMATALLVLEREATYKAANPTPAGLFVYQFEAITRNKLGFDRGLAAVEGDFHYEPAWRQFADFCRRQLGTFEFAELVYLRSELYVLDRRKTTPGYTPKVPVLFGEKEGKIAKASRGRDPMFLFAALQRQLAYPEVPRPKPPDDTSRTLDALVVKVREMEARIKMLESEVRGNFDPTQYGKPDLFREIADD